MDELDPPLLAFPGVDAEVVADDLGRRGLIGWAIDGHVMGHDGFTLALLLGVEERLVVASFDAEDVVDVELASSAEPLENVLASWPGSLLVIDELNGQRLSFPAGAAADLPVAAVAVTPPADLMLGVASRSVEVELHRAEVDGNIVIGVGAHNEVPDDFLAATLTGAKGTSVVLWRRGPIIGLVVLRKGEEQQVHWWAPAWTPVGTDETTGLREQIGTPQGDAAEIASLIARADDVVMIRALLRRQAPPIAEIVETLSLPSVVADILEGRIAVTDLPGGEVVEPQRMRDVLKRAWKPSEHDPAWMRGYDRGASELRPWYVIGNLLALVIGVLLIVEAGGIGWFRGLFGFVVALGVMIDLPVRWWLKRRRRNASFSAGLSTGDSDPAK